MKPRIIVLGGCGFIGRNLVEYLVTNDLADAIRVVDKVPPQIAWLNSKHQSAFDDPRVEFKSANLINPGSCKNALSPHADGFSYDYVINCACETKPGQTDPVYKEGILKISVMCATLSEKLQVKRYVELSSGQMYSTDKCAISEECKKEPWTQVAKWKSMVEETLPTITGLKYTILRPAIVYGPGDKTGLTPRLLVGSVYKHLGESMKLLWTRDLKMNTVHVYDVCRAIYHVMTQEETVGQIYNVVDMTDSTQGTISALVSELFNINHDYFGEMMSTVAKANMNAAVEEVNDKHLAPWADICAKANIINTPLSPYIDKELLYNKHLFMNSDKLLATGFIYEKPKLTLELLKEIVIDYSEMNLFPTTLIS